MIVHILTATIQASLIISATVLTIAIIRGYWQGGSNDES